MELTNIVVSDVKKAVNELFDVLNIKKIDDAKLSTKGYQEEELTKLNFRLSHSLFPDANPSSKKS